jgi:acyl-CoA thioester hydrolase
MTADLDPAEGRFTCRVYYEDTDLAGVVYYANYLKFIERARSEWVRARGVDQGELKAEAGLVFAVRRLEADYLAPARFDDLLEVRTRLVDLTGARIVLDQEVWRGEVVLFAARVTLVCLSDRGAVRLPAPIRAALIRAAPTG